MYTSLRSLDNKEKEEGLLTVKLASVIFVFSCVALSLCAYHKCKTDKGRIERNFNANGFLFLGRYTCGILHYHKTIKTNKQI